MTWKGLETTFEFLALSAGTLLLLAWFEVVSTYYAQPIAVSLIAIILFIGSKAFKVVVRHEDDKR